MKDYKYAIELDILNKAFKAASEAASKMISENPGTWFPCGFSSVKISPARGRFVMMLKDQKIGHNGYNGGYVIYNPSNVSTQWMDAKMEGSKAFAKVLLENGINAQAEQQID